MFNPTNGGVPPLKTQRGMSAWQDFMRRSFCEQPWQMQVQDRRQWERIEHVRRLAEQCNDTRMRVLQGDLT